jgi:hypothetical protein
MHRRSGAAITATSFVAAPDLAFVTEYEQEPFGESAIIGRAGSDVMAFSKAIGLIRLSNHHLEPLAQPNRRSEASSLSKATHIGLRVLHLPITSSGELR